MGKHKHRLPASSPDAGDTLLHVLVTRNSLQTSVLRLQDTHMPNLRMAAPKLQLDWSTTKPSWSPKAEPVEVILRNAHSGLVKKIAPHKRIFTPTGTGNGLKIANVKGTTGVWLQLWTNS